ncbi:hypothetical protein [Croceitalea rosinachiae]|uniref:Uncharacterized protein n=1 Tax=Croceitalea rosinachiae TaxID=3075596 RepID=A0ABU3AES3_9FLAO|nr:hypothetical protein [Croceitalea sp. F388]MDT0607588.1 hypothetical protein [Croceitalea sp. F388]
MFQFTQSLYRLTFIVAFLLFYNFSVEAQEKLNYQGPLSVGNYTGDANYAYRIIDSDTLFDGPFRLKRANLDALLQKQDYTFDFSGSFQDNYPNGFWKFQFGQFQSNNESQVVDYQYRVAISGVQEEASGNIVLGKPDGSWIYSVNKIEDSKISETLFKSSIIFDKGIPQQNFRIENDSLILAGRFLRNGLTHDEWSLFDSSGIGVDESWFFNDGLLQKIRIESSGSIDETPIYDNYAGQTKIINLDSRYIEALAIYQYAILNSDRPVGGKMQSLLAQNARYYKKIDDILSELGESSFLPEFKVKVPYFPFSKEEEQQINQILADYNAAELISKSFLEDTQLNILKLSDQEAAFKYEVINQISNDVLNPLKQLVLFINNKVLEFAPRKNLLESLWNETKPKSEFNIEVALDSVKINRTFKLQSSNTIDFSVFDLKTMQNISTTILANLEAIKAELNQTLLNEKRQQELIALEEKLILQRNEMHNYIDSVGVESSGNIKRTLNSLKKHADNALSNYSALTELNTKLSAGQKLLSCYLQINKLAKNIAQLPEQEDTIKEKYKDRIWNPFMATLMDEEVKKRITSAYRKFIIPYFLKHAENEFECNQVNQLNDLMSMTYQRMLELRVENTSKLERKLRKVTDPIVVLELFELQPLTTDQE